LLGADRWSAIFCYKFRSPVRRSRRLECLFHCTSLCLYRQFCQLKLYRTVCSLVRWAGRIAGCRSQPTATTNSVVRVRQDPLALSQVCFTHIEPYLADRVFYWEGTCLVSWQRDRLILRAEAACPFETMASKYQNRVLLFPEHSERLILIQLLLPPISVKRWYIGKF
jgi:hypothetical protein